MTMKKIIILFLPVLITLSAPTKSYSQAQEIAQLILDIEKLTQFKSILSDMKSGYQIISGGYGTIKNISHGNFSLHENFLNGLMSVSPAVRNYKRVADIISMQAQIIRDYKTAFNHYTSSGWFTASELSYISKVHAQLLKSCSQNIEERFTIVTAGELRMSDAQRLSAIDQLYNSMAEKKAFLGHFSSANNILLVQRQQQKNNISELQKLYGLK